MTDSIPTHPGQPFGGGFYGGQIRINDAIYAIAWAPKAEGQTIGAWINSYHAIPSAISCVDSMANTTSMAEAHSAIANWARGLSIGGHTDWCIPARDVLELGYRMLKPGAQENSCSFRDGENASSVPPGWLYTDAEPAQTPAQAFRTGGAEAFDERWYWSSTQYSADSAFIQGFDYGYQDSGDKKFEARVRAVRLIQLAP